MISPEIVASLPPSRFVDGFCSSGPWLTNGSWAAKVTPPAGIAVTEQEALAVAIRQFLTMARVDVQEDASLYLPFVAGEPRVAAICRTCSGTGECNNCTSCDAAHGCGRCDGRGEHVSKEGTPDDDGQRVYVADGVETTIAARMGLLLDGLKVVRLGSDGASAPLGGLDEHGEMVAVVMPLRPGDNCPRRKAVSL